MADDPTPPIDPAQGKPAGGTPPPPPPPSAGDDKGATPPPRPGDEVPKEGLDPSQVFASPPPPPPNAAPAGDQAAGGQPPADTGQPPKDQGPPPPPPGKTASKDDGYDDEDIRVLGEVGDYRFGSVMAGLNNDNIAVPEHPETKFDEQAFLSMLRGSISLTRDEKWRIIQAIPKLSQFQLDELQKILTEEKEKFSALSPKHLLQLQKLEQKHAQDWNDLQSVTVQEQAKEQEGEQADEIRKQLGL